MSLKNVLTMITILLVQGQLSYIKKSIFWINKSSNFFKYTATIKEDIFKLSFEGVNN